MRFSTAAIVAVSVVCGSDHSLPHRQVAAESTTRLANRPNLERSKITSQQRSIQTIRNRDDNHHDSSSFMENSRAKQQYGGKNNKQWIIPEAVQPLWEQRSSHRLEETKVRECDLDVGILTCEKHQICVPNHRSSHGGFCRSSIMQQDMNHRELQPYYGNNDTTATPFPSSTLDPNSDLATICENLSPPGATCNCSQIIVDPPAGEVKCSYDDPRCYFFNGTACGYVDVDTVLQIDSAADSYSFQYCLTIEQEEFCYAVRMDYSRGEVMACSATLNGCTCECQIAGEVCQNTATEVQRLQFYCPNDLTSSTCRNFDVFFGNDVAACDDDTGNGGLPTLAPSKNNDGGPTIDETMMPNGPPTGTAPSITTLTPVATLPPGAPEKTPAPTLASSGNSRHSAWRGSIVAGYLFYMLQMN
jgi:hypothetical protein